MITRYSKILNFFIFILVELLLPPSAFFIIMKLDIFVVI